MDVIQTPLVIITGFLGSGKTTLVNRLLREGFGAERVAVVVNDFGKINVDAALIVHAEESMLKLDNGCICCTLAGDLAAGHKGLLDAQIYDPIVMETSGVTAIESLKRTLLWPGLAERLRLERVVAVVDAVRHPKLHCAVRVIDEQVSHADVVILNICDAASEEERRESERAIRAVNPQAPIIATAHCQLTREQIELPSVNDGALKIGGQASDEWFSCRILFEGPVEWEALERAARELTGGVHRLKGFVRAAGGGVIHLERVGERLDMENWIGAVPAGALDTLVAIGSTPIVEELREKFGGTARASVISDHALHAHPHDEHHHGQKHHHEQGHHHE